jgi:hypothetical protein
MTRRKRYTKKDCRRSLVVECLETRRVLAGPYSPAAGLEGSTAIHYLDPRIQGWASEVVEYLPGSDVNATFQDISQAIGPADPSVSTTVTLGRGGEITVGFLFPIRDGLGFDFAVFENGVSDTFLELGKVEVSSDGLNFFAFDSDSLTANPVAAFGGIDATNVDGLAGKYRVGYGTPFDLSSLRGIDAALNVDRITHVRILDVIGDGSELDSQGDPIYDPYPTIESAGFDLDGVAVMHFLDKGETSVDFEDVGQTLLPGSAFFGPMAGGEQSEGEYGEWITEGWFQSGGLEFNNTHSDFFDYGYTSWAQWAYSNKTDNVTSGYENQFGVSPGIGAAGSETFGIAYVDQVGSFSPPTVRKIEGDTRQFGSLLITNTTYAALSMRNGDSFAKKFGGATGEDEDFFLLTITGKDGLGIEIGAIDVYLADYRFADNQRDYILDDWRYIDLSSLSQAASLEFTLQSSDVGDFGMNTPAYFAVDQIQLTEPTLYLDVDPITVTEGVVSSLAAARVSRFYSDDTLATNVAIVSEPSSRLVVPQSITIPVDASFTDFGIEVLDDDSFQGDQFVLVSASAAGFISDTQNIEVLENDSRTLQLSSTVSNLSEGGSATVLVTRNDSDLTNSLQVTLSTNNESLVDLPAVVVIPAGESAFEFTVNSPEDSFDRPNTSVDVNASADGYVAATITLNWEDNDGPALTMTSDLDTYSESQSLPTVGFEVIGRTFQEESYLNGSDQRGGFESKGLFFNNHYDTQFGSWSGWAISKTTDTTTPGYLNQYSSFVGQGDIGSDTYAVASVYGYPSLPIIQRDPNASLPFHSISVANTTYAARSMLEGDAFAKKFGGETGSDPDWFMLTIEGFDQQQQSIGTVDFYLADYRFEDNQLDYVVDSWVSVPLHSISEAVELQFSLSSSDVGDFGMNTPYYFAIDQVASVAQIPQPQISIHRNTFDVSSDLPIVISSSDTTEIANVGSITIPAGFREISVPLSVLHDDWVDGDRPVAMRATSNGFLPADLSLTVTDIDVAEITLSLAGNVVGESGGPVQMLVHRNVENVENALSVGVTANPSGQVQASESVLIPSGSKITTTSIEVINNQVRDGDRDITIFGSADGFVSGATVLSVEDDEKELVLSIENSRLAEQDGRIAVSFEDLGTQLPPNSYLDGRKESGWFSASQVELNNSYDPTFSTWFGWAISNTDDSQTPGYENQFSSIVGAGAEDSKTYAIANAYPGYLVPEIVLSDDHSTSIFDSIMVTNTTYAYRSMLEGDAFSKKFGGVSGSDPDYFLLKIKGVNAAGEDVGDVVFPLADFRYQNTADDYIVDRWVQVDLSSLVGAKSLRFELESSDVGAFGMNTPAYFAVDRLVLRESNYLPTVVTVTRENDDLMNELVVSLASSDSSEAQVSRQIIIPAGVANYEFPVHAVDDFVVDGEKLAVISAVADGYLSGNLDLTVEDDDIPQLSLSIWSEQIEYVEGDTIDVVVHRNDAVPLNELEFQLVDVSQQFLATDVLRLAVGQTSGLFELTVGQNRVLEGDRIVNLGVRADGYLESAVEVPIADDEVAQLNVRQLTNPILLGELTDGESVFVSLASQPLGDVQIDVLLGVASIDVISSVDKLVFTSDNWDVEQVVMFSAIPDLLVEGDEDYSVSFTVDQQGTTPLYSSVESVNVSLRVRNQDPSQLRIMTDSTSISLFDIESQRMIQRQDLATGLNVVANDLNQSIEILKSEVQTGPIEVSLRGGNDIAIVFGENFNAIDGGADRDELSLQIENSYNFGDLLAGRVTSFESYHLDGGPVHIDSLGLPDLAMNGETIYLKLSQNQQITFGSKAVLQLPAMHESSFVHVIQLGEVQLLVQPGRPWRNPVDHYNVDASDNGVSAVDALKIINELASREDFQLPPIENDADFGGNYWDVSGDDRVSGLDAIQVINELARQSIRAAGEWLPALWNQSLPNDSSSIEFPELTLQDEMNSDFRVYAAVDFAGVLSEFDRTDRAVSTDSATSQESLDYHSTTMIDEVIVELSHELNESLKR